MGFSKKYIAFAAIKNDSDVLDHCNDVLVEIRYACMPLTGCVVCCLAFSDVDEPYGTVPDFVRYTVPVRIEQHEPIYVP